VIEVSILGDGGDTTEIRLEARGPNARLANHVQSLVAGTPDNGSVDAHGIQAFYTGLVARASNMKVRIDATADGVSIAASPVLDL
jgi:histidine phosphotransferase ChpT